MDEIESQDVVTEDAIEEVSEEETTEDADKTTEDTKATKPEETPQQKKARLERQLKRVKKELGEDDEEVTPSKAKTDKLDDTVLDYLDLKGVSESEDVAVVESIMKKTGMSARDALKDDYVIAKLAALKSAREVKDALPSATKRGGGDSVGNVARAVAKFEKDGTLPDDFDLRSKVVDAIEAKTGNNKPIWHS